MWGGFFFGEAGRVESALRPAEATEGRPGRAAS